MFLRGLPSAPLVLAVLVTAGSTQLGTDTPGPGPLAHTDPGGRSEIHGNYHRLPHGRRHRNGQYWEARMTNEERQQARKERNDEEWTEREEREERSNPMEEAWERIVERTEEEGKRSIADEEERRGGMFGREEETRRNAEGTVGGMKGGREMIKERGTGSERAMIKRLEHEPKEMRERMKEKTEENRLTNKHSDREKAEMETKERIIGNEREMIKRLEHKPKNLRERMKEDTEENRLTNIYSDREREEMETKDRETRSERGMIKRLEHEPREMRERMKEGTEENTLTNKHRDREREEMETDGDELWREGIRDRRMSKWAVNKVPLGRETFIHEKDTGKRTNVAAREKKEDTLRPYRIGERERQKENRGNTTNKPISNNREDKFIPRPDGERSNMDESESLPEIMAKVGTRRERVDAIEGEGDEKNEGVNEEDGRMRRRNERGEEGTRQRGEWEMPETEVGNRQTLRTEEQGNNEERMGEREKENDRLRSERGDERGREIDGREEWEGRDELPGRKLERRREAGVETETEKDVGKKREERIREEEKQLRKKEKEERLKREDKMTDELDKKERENEEEKDAMKKTLEKIENKKEEEEKNGENIETVIMDKNKNILRKLGEEKTDNNTKDVEENRKTERVTEKRGREINETNKEERKEKRKVEEENNKNKSKDADDMNTKRITKKTEHGNETNKEAKTTKQKEEKEDNEAGTKTKEANTTEKFPNKNETRKEKPDKENRGGEKKEGRGGGGGRGGEEEEEEAAGVLFLRALKEKGREKNAGEKLPTMQAVKGKQANTINISNNEEVDEKTPDKVWNTTNKQTGKTAKFFSPPETKERNRLIKKGNKIGWNETMDRSTNKRHTRSNNEKERGKDDREVMVLREMKRELEKQIRRKEKQAEKKIEKEKEDSKVAKFFMGGKGDNKTTDIEEMALKKEKNKRDKEKEQELNRNMELRRAVAQLLSEQRVQASEKAKRRKEEDKVKENWKITPRKYKTERNMKSWIGDEKVDGMEGTETKEEKRKKRKKMQEEIGKATFKFLTEGDKGKERKGEGFPSASVMRSEMLKALNVSVANRTWEDVKREMKQKYKETKMNEKMQKEAEQRQRWNETIPSSAGTKENEGKEENEEDKSLMAGGVTDERREGNKTDDEKATHGGEKTVNKSANETKPGERRAAQDSDGSNTTKGSEPTSAILTQTRNETSHYLLPPTLLLTHGSSSPKYLLPTWECALSLIGVKTDSHVTVRFQTLTKDERFITLHLQRQWTAEEVKKAGARQAGPGDAGEAMLAVSGPRGGVDVVAREAVRLHGDAWTFFSVFRKDRVFAVFRAGQQLPFLVYVAPPTAAPFIPHLRLVQVWSKGDAEWDLLGDKYRGENGGREPKDCAIRRELTEMRRGLPSRLGVAAVLQEHGWRPEDDDPRLVKYKRLRESLATLRPLKTLLLYYGRAGSANDTWHDEEHVRRFLASRDIGSVLH